jgi:hypothetical protein
MDDLCGTASPGSAAGLIGSVARNLVLLVASATALLSAGFLWLALRRS